MNLPFQQLVLASNNAGKLRELQHLLNPLHIEVIAQSRLHIPEADEPYPSFVENALAKARHASQLTGMAALADDSGLCVDALQGAPGVLSARFACDHPDAARCDQANNEKLLRMMQGVEQRRAYFYCVIVLVRHAHDPQPVIAEGVWKGEILSSPRGEHGFGYDPVFLDVMTGLSGAEIPLEIKSRISHRGHAMTRLLQKLERMSHDESK